MNSSFLLFFISIICYSTSIIDEDRFFNDEFESEDDDDFQPISVMSTEDDVDSHQSDSSSEGPTPPEVVFRGPLDPLSTMTETVVKPPGFRPPKNFKAAKDSSEVEQKIDVGFVRRHGRQRAMGFSRRKADN